VPCVQLPARDHAVHGVLQSPDSPDEFRVPLDYLWPELFVSEDNLRAGLVLHGPMISRRLRVWMP